MLLGWYVEDAIGASLTDSFMPTRAEVTVPCPPISRCDSTRSLLDDGVSVIFSDGSGDGLFGDDNLNPSPTGTSYSEVFLPGTTFSPVNSFGGITRPTETVSRTPSFNSGGGGTIPFPNLPDANVSPVIRPVRSGAFFSPRPSHTHNMANMSPSGRIIRRNSGNRSLLSRGINASRSRAAATQRRGGGAVSDGVTRPAQDESSWLNLYETTITEEQPSCWDDQYPGDGFLMDLDDVFGHTALSMDPAGLGPPRPSELRMDPFANADNSENGHSDIMDYLDSATAFNHVVCPPTPEPPGIAAGATSAIQPVPSWPLLNTDGMGMGMGMGMGLDFLAVPKGSPRRPRGNSAPSAVPAALTIPMNRSRVQAASHSATTPTSLDSACSSLDTILRGQRSQRAANGTRGAAAQTSASLERIQEMKLGPAVRGKRQGKLTDEARAKARKARAEKTVCIRCKFARHTVSLSNAKEGVNVQC
jgi:hypothetical protein